MSHYLTHTDLALDLVDGFALFNPDVEEDLLKSLTGDLSCVVTIGPDWSELLRVDVPHERAMGFGLIHHDRRWALTIRMGNAVNHPASLLSTVLATGAMLNLPKAIELLHGASGSIWPGLGALLTVSLAQLRPFVEKLPWEPAVVLSLAWDHMSDEAGFPLIDKDRLLAGIGDAAAVYNYRGLNADKVHNAMVQLEDMGLVRTVFANERWQLSDSLLVKSNNIVRLQRA